MADYSPRRHTPARAGSPRLLPACWNNRLWAGEVAGGWWGALAGSSCPGAAGRAWGREQQGGGRGRVASVVAILSRSATPRLDQLPPRPSCPGETGPCMGKGNSKEGCGGRRKRGQVEEGQPASLAPVLPAHAATHVYVLSTSAQQHDLSPFAGGGARASHGLRA